MPARWITFLPYLPLERELTISSDWRLVPAPDSALGWPSAGYELAARSLLEGHRDHAGDVIRRPVLGIYRDQVMPLERPPHTHALERAVTLTALMTNPKWGPDANGFNAITTDNAAVHVWEREENQIGFAEQRGAVVRNLNGGLEFSASEFLRAPLELHLPSVVTGFDADLATCAFDVLVAEDVNVGRGLGVAIDWLSQAWLNSPGIGWGVRCAFIVFGFEALLKGDGWKQTKRIRRRFEALPAELAAEPTSLIWSPLEELTMTVDAAGATHQVTPLQHWYLTLNRYRNSVVHADAAPIGPAYEHGTAYDGPLFQTGERVLRDLITAELTLACEIALTKTPTWRSMVARLESGGEQSELEP